MKHFGLVVLFVVSFIGFNLLEMHKRGLLTSPTEQEMVQLEEVVVTAQPIIITEPVQKVNSSELEDVTEQLHHVQVQKGDSLWKIAQAVYGDASRWVEIYEQNRDQIGDNPDLIFPGQVLTLSSLDMNFTGAQ